MIECPKCGHDERFVQHCDGYRRQVHQYIERSAVRAEKGVWKQTTEQSRYPFVCSVCGAEIRVSQRLVKAWRLDDLPVTTSDSLDLDEVLVALRKISAGAEIHVEEGCGCEGNYASFDELRVKLTKELRAGVEERLGISLERCYSHQIEALRHAFAGKNVVLQTPTASGKSLCYLLPIFQELLTHPDATALFVFPMKALAFDQRKKIAQISENFDESTLTANRFIWPLRFGSKTVWMGSYERETKNEHQRDVKAKARIVVTNPDSLHMKILPHFATATGSWERFFSNLAYVVLDEIHTYRGLFGAHVAYVIRRLRMICERLGADPHFFCSSATLPDPLRHAEQLVGLPFTAVTRSGAPKHRKAFVLWNPGLQKKSAKEGERREPTTDAIELLSKVLLKQPEPIQSITFMRTLAGVERFNRTLRDRLHGLENSCADKTCTYKSTLLLEERNEVSEGLQSGQVVHVTSTNALELGIDIGDLRACLMIGYPGTVSSFLQQSGRVGRKAPSLVLLLLRDDPLEQWFARNPNQFFRYVQKVEPLRLPIDNSYVMAQQAMCAAWDLNPIRKKEILQGLTEDLFKKYFGCDAREKIKQIIEGRKVTPPSIREAGAYWIVREKFDDVYHSIRVPISIGKFQVTDENGRAVGECDSTLVPRDLFPGAIWINNGRLYHSKRIVRSQLRVEVQALDDRVDHYTIAMPRTSLTCDEANAQIRKSGGCLLGRGGVTVRREVKLYREVPVASDSKDAGEVKTTKTDPIEYLSTAFWLDVPEETLLRCGIQPRHARGAMHALEHVLRSVFPLVADVDPGDLGSCLDVVESPGEKFRCRLYLFDSFAGGTGLSDHAYTRPRQLVDAAADLLQSCRCKAANGCPRCTIIPWCEFLNDDLSKEGARKLLAGLKGVQ